MSEKNNSNKNILKKDSTFKKVIERIHPLFNPKNHLNTMCVVSKNIKFCTCEEDSTSERTNYWVLHRFNKDKDLRIVGNIVMSTKDLDPNYKPNKKTIRNRLNKQDAFDKEIPFVENDVLKVVLNSDDYENRKDFCFEYKSGIWIDAEYDSLSLKSRFNVYGFGKVLNQTDPSA